MTNLYNGQAEVVVDIRRGVIYVNGKEGCILRICGLKGKLDESIVQPGRMLDITILNSLTSKRGAD